MILKKMKDFIIKNINDLPKLRQIMEVCQIKPNYSQLARELGVDRRTVKKYYHGYQKPIHRNKQSKISDYHDIIKTLLSEDSIQVFHYMKHLWQYLVDNHDFPLKEGTLRNYIRKQPEFFAYFKRRRHTKKNVTHLRFETEPGQQLQIDWKENMRFKTSDGKELDINVFVAVLGYSRYSTYHVTLNRKQTTLFTVLNDTFEKIGGIPKELLTDNMKTVMDQSRTAYQKGKINAEFERFSKDYGFGVKNCIAFRANTKGKVESQMKLLDEIDAYQGKFTFDELVAHVQLMNLRKNMNIHPMTGQSPITLFEQEKDSLLPLPSKEIRSRYYYQSTVKVNASSMVSYQSNLYSVPLEYVGKQVGIEIEDNHIYIYDNTKEIANHPIKDHKLNYTAEHYQEMVKKTMPYKSKEEVEDYSKKNLERISAAYGAT